MGWQHIGKNIKRFREAHHMTQEQLAEIIDVRQASVSDCERGKNVPDVSIWGSICDALCIPEAALLADNPIEEAKLLLRFAIEFDDTSVLEIEKLKAFMDNDFTEPLTDNEYDFGGNEDE